MDEGRTSKEKKLMRMQKVFHLKNDRQHVLRKEGGRGLASTEESIDASIQELEDYIKKEQKKTNYSNQKQNR